MNVHKYILPKLCFTPEKISKYTGIGDFVGLGQTSVSPWVRSRGGTQIRILFW